ncbi:MAG: LPXTG cell wall anchor domain-containing protein [Ignavibacteria bacterium]|nr:LPXTG cell wall anchor domain-containing protein [Ignavibacteria bacterium]
MRVLTVLFLLLGILNFCFGQGRNLPIDSLVHISVDSIVVYDDPYVITNGEIEYYGFSPVWLKGFCSTNIPTFFKRDASKAMPYVHHSLDIEEFGLQQFYDKWVPNPNINLAIYILGDIYFHDKINKDMYIMSPIWAAPFNYPVRISQLDTTKLGGNHRVKLDSCDTYYPFYQNDHGAFLFYKYEDGVFKKCRDSYLYEVLRWDLKASGGMFSSAKGFITMVNRQKTYTRSRLVNGHRIFETVKNTPDGPVVVGENDGKAWVTRYWWAIAIGLAVVGLLGFVVFRRRNKEK